MIAEMLINYRDHKASKCFKERDIKALEIKLFHANHLYVEDETECIVGMQMAANVVETDRPQRSNKFSSKTENTASNYSEEMVYKNEFDILTIKRNIDKINEEMLKYVETVEIVDIALTLLDEKERLAIETKYFKGYTIPEVVECFAQKYRYGVEKTLERIILNAIEKMDKWYLKNVGEMSAKCL